MKIGVGLIFYNDVESLKKCIPSLKVDKIYAIDGRFKNFDSPQPLSDDGSRQYLKSFKNVKLIDAPDLEQVDKRNIYLKECQEEFLIVIDSDEWVEGDWSLFRKEIDNKVKKENGPCFWFWMIDLERNSKHWQCLGFLNPNKIQYKHRHDWIEVDGKRILPNSHNNNYTKLNHLVIFNEKKLRGNEREILGKKWREENRKKEFRRTKIIDVKNKIKNLF